MTNNKCRGDPINESQKKSLNVMILKLILKKKKEKQKKMNSVARTGS